jgi:hypothetical protein
MQEILWGVFTVSALHALFPFHWLPLLATGKVMINDVKKENALLFQGVGLHIGSTLMLGYVVAWIGSSLEEWIGHYLHILLPFTLIGLGIYTILHFRNGGHHPGEGIKKKAVTKGIVISMALMPCIEIEPFFLLSGAKGIKFIALVSLMYVMATLLGMWIWMKLFRWGMMSKWWGKNEGIAGKTVGLILILSGIAGYFGEM